MAQIIDKVARKHSSFCACLCLLEDARLPIEYFRVSHQLQSNQQALRLGILRAFYKGARCMQIIYLISYQQTRWPIVLIQSDKNFLVLLEIHNCSTLLFLFLITRVHSILQTTNPMAAKHIKAGGRQQKSKSLLESTKDSQLKR